MKITQLACVHVNPPILPGTFQANCILVETDQEKVLIDTGLGLQDVLEPNRYIRRLKPFLGIDFDAGDTVVGHLLSLQIQPESIGHIVLTHLHFDHAGGLTDFPQAAVHVHRREYDAMKRPRKFMERIGYNRANFSHGPDWHFYESATENWLGFEVVKLPFSFPCYLVELHGHTSGHCGVALQKEDGSWLFHVGDAAPAGMKLGNAPDWLVRLILGKNSLRFKTFSEEHPEVEVVTGHGAVGGNI